MFLFNINRSIDPIVSWLGDWLGDITIESIIIRLILSALFGGIIGIERTTKKHAAGLRTYILVCIGSCMAMLTNQFIVEVYDYGDVGRIGAQVISGIGFLGAGTIIITSRNRIKGLTTAAALWACATMGLAIGIGFYTLAIIGFVVIFGSITFLPFLENYFTKHTSNYELHIEFVSSDNLREFIKYVRERNMKIKSLEKNLAYESSGLSVYTIYLSHEREFHLEDHSAIIEDIRKLDYVNYVEEIY